MQTASQSNSQELIKSPQQPTLHSLIGSWTDVIEVETMRYSFQWPIFTISLICSIDISMIFLLYMYEEHKTEIYKENVA